MRIKHRLFVFFLLLYSTGFTFAKNSDTTIVNKYAKKITAHELKKHLTELASDKYEGRETGEKGQQLAANYLAEYYKSLSLLKLKDNYFQEYSILQERAKTSSIKFNDTYYTFLKDYYFFPRFEEQELNGSEIIFAGYGIKDSIYNSYKNINVKFKIVVIIDGEPKKNKNTFLLTNSDTPSVWSEKLQLKIDAAQAQGANAILIVDEKIEKNIQNYRHTIEKPITRLDGDNKLKGKMPYIFISPLMASDLLGKEYKKIVEETQASNTTASFSNVGKIIIDIERNKENSTAQNVLAYIPGKDKKEEFVIISAHYDHLGIQNGKIYYGADDDGSGTVAVMEMAKAFKEAYRKGHGPNRSILFINFSGEEKGLLGSDYYTRNPIVPLQKTVCNLNIDMIGRVDNEHKNNSNYIYVIGSDKLSSELHAINERANTNTYNLLLDYMYNTPNDPYRFYYRSDHYNFAKNQIPVIFYFTGVHEDYHRPTDTVDKIDFEKMEKITRVIFTTAWEVANREERLKVDSVNDFKN